MNADLMVTVQYQERRKPYPWKTAFRAKVLYADNQVILVRGAGGHSLFRGNGIGSHGISWKTNSAFGKKVEAHPRQFGWFRISPAGMEKIKADIELGGGKAPAF